LLALGVAVRLFHYIDNRSFFIDELFLNVNLIKLSFWQLATEPLAYEQKAPLGYLWAARASAALLGRQEQALRLVSLLSGVGALGYFVPVARFFLRPWAATLAVGLLALGYPAVYHSVEAKQYSTELLAAVLALGLYVHYHERPSLAARLAWGVLGGLLLWFSFSTIFVLVGCGVALAWHTLRPTPASATAQLKLGRRLGLLALPGALWLLSFALLYHFFLGKYHDPGWLTYFFKIKYDAYLPLFHPVAAAKWLASKAYDFLDYPLGILLKLDDSLEYLGFKHVLKMGWLSVPLFGWGTYSLWRKQPAYCLALLVPFVLALAASAASQYPFYQRFTLFLAPSLLLVLAYGVQEISGRHSLGRAARWVLPGLLLLPPFINSAHQVFYTDSFHNREYYRDVLLHVNARYQPGDAVYVYWNMRQAYDYYKPAYGLRYTAIEGSYVKNQSSNQADYLRRLQADFAPLRGKKRLWFVYDSNNRDAIGDYVDQPAWYHAQASSPGQLLDNYFSSLGKKTAHFQIGNHAATLYELRP